LTYHADKIIGSGTFGVVYQANCIETGEKVAIKKVFQDKKYKNRELQIIRELSHCNIVKLLSSFLTTAETVIRLINLKIIIIIKQTFFMYSQMMFI